MARYVVPAGSVRSNTGQVSARRGSLSANNRLRAALLAGDQVGPQTGKELCGHMLQLYQHRTLFVCRYIYIYRSSQDTGGHPFPPTLARLPPIIKTPSSQRVLFIFIFISSYFIAIIYPVLFSI